MKKNAVMLIVGTCVLALLLTNAEYVLFLVILFGSFWSANTSYRDPVMLVLIGVLFLTIPQGITEVQPFLLAGMIGCALGAYVLGETH